MKLFVYINRLSKQLNVFYHEHKKNFVSHGSRRFFEHRIFRSRFSDTKFSEANFSRPHFPTANFSKGIFSDNQNYNQLIIKPNQT